MRILATLLALVLLSGCAVTGAVQDGRAPTGCDIREQRPPN